MRKKVVIFSLILTLLLTLPACAREKAAADFHDLTSVGELELKFANQFRVDYLSDGSALINIEESGRFLLIPEGQKAPVAIDPDIIVLQQPLTNIYLAATSAMCLFDSLDALDHIAMSGTQAEGWYIENARLAMERGDIVYAGKYNAPDYELLMANDCGLALESTMIYHAPEVKEKLEAVGIPVLVERSSYESHPLGRTEWIKFYGLLLDREKEAEAIFNQQAAYLEALNSENTGKSVAFFYISSSGSAVARKSNDYAVKMIELAGGNYIFTDLGDAASATGSVNLEMERFYAEAGQADIIIYNSSIDGEVSTLDQLIAKNQLLADFKAVQSGDVWCSSKNLFQETTDFGLMVAEMNQIFRGQARDDLNFFFKLR